jgi:hypothetical protein
VLNGNAIAMKAEQFEDSTKDVTEAQVLIEDYLARNSHSLKDEIDEFFREIAALRGKSEIATVKEMKVGSQKYLEAIKTQISFKNNLPLDFDLYMEKVNKIAEGIESCWDLFSLESRNFFIQVAYGFCQAGLKLEGWQGFWLRIKLFLPSLKKQENLFIKYKYSFTLIPKAVNSSLELRQSKSTRLLEITAQKLLKNAQDSHERRANLYPYLKNLGRDPEDQLQKNQPAIAWAKARLDQIEQTWNNKEEE